MSERFAILNPCAKRWTDLRGEGRKRLCDECQTFVHVLDQYSVEEFAELKRSSGRVCGFLAAQSLPEPRSRRAILIGAFLTAISPLMAQSGRVRIRVTDITAAVVAQSEASLLGPDGNPRTVQGKGAGEIVLTDLPLGVSKLRLTGPGFGMLLASVTVHNSKEVKVEATLMVSVTGMIVEVEPQRLRPKRRWWQVFR
jgi:hypothetical protein